MGFGVSGVSLQAMPLSKYLEVEGSYKHDFMCGAHISECRGFLTRRIVSRAEMSFASDMRPMPASHGPNAAFMSRPTRFQGRQVSVLAMSDTLNVLGSAGVNFYVAHHLNTR